MIAIPFAIVAFIFGCFGYGVLQPKKEKTEAVMTEFTETDYQIREWARTPIQSPGAVVNGIKIK